MAWNPPRPSEDHLILGYSVSHIRNNSIVITHSSEVKRMAATIIHT